jgi:hypothetical protein
MTPETESKIGHSRNARLRSWAIVLGVATLCAIVVSQTAPGVTTGDALGLAAFLVVAQVLTVSITGAWWSEGPPAWRWEDPPGWSVKRQQQLLNEDFRREESFAESRVSTAGGRSFRAQVPLVVMVDAAWLLGALAVYDATAGVLWLLTVGALAIGLLLVVTTCLFGWPFVLLLPEERRPPGWRALRRADRLERAARGPS